MKRILRIQLLGATIIIALMALALSAPPVLAGMKEAKAAYDAKDYKTAFEEYLPLAEAGNADAQYWIGYIYRYGLGRKQNYKKAVEWFIKAAKNGDVAVIGDLGYMAGKGHGMPKSIDREICLYRLAAERGYSDAQWNLYLTLPVNFSTIDEVKSLLNRAARQGQPNALARKGALLTLNPLVFDKTEGLMYLVLAQKYGDDPEVDDVLEKVVGDNPSRKKQLEKAKAMAAKWKPIEEPDPENSPPPDFIACLDK